MINYKIVTNCEKVILTYLPEIFLDSVSRSLGDLEDQEKFSRKIYLKLFYKIARGHLQ